MQPCLNKNLSKGVRLKLNLYLISVFSLIIALGSSSSFGDIDDYFPSKPGPSTSNYGDTGIFNMPNGRLMEEGTLRFGISSSFPNEYTVINASPFSWLEASYRYTEVENRKYGWFFYSGNQSLKDKSFDIKFRVLKESYYLPNVALGLRDLAGTGLTSSEYLVASKRFGRLDLSLGLGFGLLGLDQNIRNPLIGLHDSFENRTGNKRAGKGGKFSPGDWFSGQRAALFGGLEYNIPKHGLTLKMEYDSTRPDIYFRRNVPLEVKSRANFGLNYSIGKWADLGVSYERGTQLRVSIFVKSNFNKPLVPKNDGPLRVASLNYEQKQRVSEDKELFYRSLNLGLRQESIFLQGATISEEKVNISIGHNRFVNTPRAAGRAARIASALSPNKVEEIAINVMNGDIEVSSIKINRKEFDKADKVTNSQYEVLSKSDIYSFSASPEYRVADFKPKTKFPEFWWRMTPALRHQIGGPEAFYLGQLWWKVNSTIKFQRNLALYTTLGFDIYNNFEDLNNPSAATIPHVRSDIQEYLKEGENNLARFKLEYMFSPYKDVFGRLDFGLLEEMFGGIGGEILYRPFKKNYFLGLTIHRVKQRDFDQRFSFRDYKTTTGFLELYNEWPNEITSQILVGKYLAGDKGATLNLSRRFNTGFRLGIFATKTNLSEEEFGEGSFDKGFYFSIPVHMFYPKHQTGNITFGLHPLTKDGGAVLNYHNWLYSILADTNEAALLRDWDGLLD